jgi:hypothetical protein
MSEQLTTENGRIAWPTREPDNDVTPPCAQCGESDIHCACGRPITTVMQIQRALEAAGCLSLSVVSHAGEYTVALRSGDRLVRSAQMSPLSDAIEDAIDQWWYDRERMTTDV